MSRRIIHCTLTSCILLAGTTVGWSQVVTFRLETTDLIGTPIESVMTGEEFLLKTYTQHVGGYVSPTNSGVFAGYLDISYDAPIASIAGGIEHGPMYSNVKSGDLSVPGLMDDIGGVSSSENFIPPGPDEQFLFSVPMRAELPGQLSFVGSDSLSPIQHSVLVYGLNEPVPARDVDFGAADVRIDFGAATLSILPVPEPHNISMLLLAFMGTVLGRRRKRA